MENHLFCSQGLFHLQQLCYHSNITNIPAGQREFPKYLPSPQASLRDVSFWISAFTSRKHFDLWSFKKRVKANNIVTEKSKDCAAPTWRLAVVFRWRRWVSLRWFQTITVKQPQGNVFLVCGWGTRKCCGIWLCVQCLVWMSMRFQESPCREF